LALCERFAENQESAVEANQAALSNAMKFTSDGGKVKIKAQK
jgi:hypothetical protein